MVKSQESKEGAKAPANKKTSAKKSTVSDFNVDVELIGRIPTAHKYGYDEVRITIKDVPTANMSETVKTLQKDFDKALMQTRKFHGEQMEVDEVIKYLS